MIKKLIKWFKRNPCKECEFYHSKDIVCQSKKVATCGRHPYVDWFDRHLCQPYEPESEDKQ